MVRRVNYGKIAVVIFLTVLIWVWADLDKTEEFPVSGAAISVARSTNPSLWVSFNDDESSVSIDNIVLKGPASRISDAQRKLNDGSLVLAFFLDAEQERIVDPGEYPLNVLDFLRHSSQIKELGLTVESCKPDTLSVNVVKLVKKTLTVKCFNEDGTPLKAESKPSTVNMFVPEEWEGETLTAEVRLTRSEVGHARDEAVVTKAYIKLGGQIREAAGTVEITVSPEEDRLIDTTMTKVTLGITFSQILKGKYDVEVENLPEVIGGITIRATPEAIRAYEGMRYHVILEIYDEDAEATESTEPLKRELIYNFPAEYVGKGEIELKNPDQTVEARFKLKRLPSAESPSNE